MPKKSDLKQCMYVIDETLFLGIVINSKIEWLQGETSKITPLSEYDDDLSHAHDSILNIVKAFNAESYEKAREILNAYELLCNADLL